MSLIACVVVVSVAALAWNGIMVVAFAEAGPAGRTTVDIAAGLTVMRIGNIVGPPVFGLALLSSRDHDVVARTSGTGAAERLPAVDEYQ